MPKKSQIERDIREVRAGRAPAGNDGQDIDFTIRVGQLGYRVTVRSDPYRGGYVARLIADGIGTVMEPNGSSRSDALARLVSDLFAGDATDRKVAREIELRGGGVPVIGTMTTFDHDRARRIVRLAADQVKNPSTKSWLLADERGTWEKAARDYLEKTADKARSLGMSEDKVDEEIAVVLGFQALQASLEHARKHRAKHSKR